MKELLARSLCAASTCALVLLAACGGGGGGGDALPAPATPTPAPYWSIPATTALGASAQYADICDFETRKKFVRSYLDEVYLWYDEIVDVDAAQYATISDCFHALLVRTPDVNGLPKDRFSVVLPAPAGDEWTQVSALGAGELPASQANPVPVSVPVQSLQGRPAWYLQFNRHDIGAQDALILEFQKIQAAHIGELVLDLRDNPGGYLYIARTAASMITGPAANGKLFERLQYSGKRAQETLASGLLFSGSVETGETFHAAGAPLPQLGLPRVFVLTSRTTCSASESIINGLQGIDMQVIRIGATTCGKPYGFHQRNNCGDAFFPIEFKGVNAKGYGDYTAGIAPTCAVADNTSVLAGSSNDPLLKAALDFMDTGACPATSGARPLTLDVASVRPARPVQSAWSGRVLERPAY